MRAIQIDFLTGAVTVAHGPKRRNYSASRASLERLHRLLWRGSNRWAIVKRHDALLRFAFVEVTQCFGHSS